MFTAAVIDEETPAFTCLFLMWKWLKKKEIMLN